MLKRKLMKAGLFGNGLILFFATVNRANEQSAEIAAPTVAVDPFMKQLQAFDSSFIELNAFPADVLSEAPKIRLNTHVVKFVKDYNSHNTEELEIIRKRGERYFPLIDSIFTSYRLPVELKYLAAIESRLNAKARSKVGAAGPWQLMPGTAKVLSLKIRGSYDERTNYSKSTVAAAKYLRDLYSEFSDWLLVIAAYNSGPGKVEYAIKQSGSHNFWKLQNFLPAETRGHVKRFIATHYYFEEYGGITTLTRTEVVAYKNSIAQFIAKQKAGLLKDDASKVDVTISSEDNTEAKNDGHK